MINDKGEILNFVITPGNTDDREPLKDKKFIEKLKGKLYADKGYVSQKLTEILFVDGLHLITHIRNNMKNVLMEMKDKILLRKRSVIETINDELKNICSIEHSRHRSFQNFITNLISGLIAYYFFPKKPAIKYEVIKTDQIVEDLGKPFVCNLHPVTPAFFLLWFYFLVGFFFALSFRSFSA